MVMLIGTYLNCYFSVIVSRVSTTTRDTILLKVETLLQKYHIWRRTFIAFQCIEDHQISLLLFL